MQEKSYSKKSYSDNTLEEESISLLEWDSLKTHLSSFASTEMGKRAILSFAIPSEYEASKRLLNETDEINSFLSLGKRVGQKLITQSKGSYKR